MHEGLVQQREQPTALEAFSLSKQAAINPPTYKAATVKKDAIISVWNVVHPEKSALYLYHCIRPT